MLYYDRIDIWEGIDPAKSNKSKEFLICHFWLLNHGLIMEVSVCNVCSGLTNMLSVNIRDITIITDYYQWSFCHLLK